MYTLEFDRRVRKDMQTLPNDAQRRVLAIFDKLQDNPFTVSYKKLREEDSYRVRMGDYRIVYNVDSAERKVTVLRVAHRKDVYRR